jgi:predicted SAM-dependent methyltransferase
MAYNKFEHFQLERKLANQLRATTAEQRRSMYGEVYTVLFSTFPELANKHETSPEERIGWQLKLVQKLYNKDKVFLEIGAGDCALSKAIAPYFKKIVAYEVSDSIPFIDGKPSNFELKIFNGVDMYEPDGSMDIIYSNQVFEHLHTDDTLPLLKTYHNFLSKNGKLVVITPHRLTGPHDISRDFTKEAEGFHMKEYTYKELRDQMKTTGFRNIKGYVGHNKLGYFSLPMWLLIFAENIGDCLPKFLKKKLKTNKLAFNFFGMKVIATKK